MYTSLVLLSNIYRVSQEYGNPSSTLKVFHIEHYSFQGNLMVNYTTFLWEKESLLLPVGAGVVTQLMF